jgi:hypothetical protein
MGWYSMAVEVLQYVAPPANAGKPMRSYISGPGYMVIDGLQYWGMNMPKVMGLWKKAFWLLR